MITILAMIGIGLCVYGYMLTFRNVRADRMQAERDAALTEVGQVRAALTAVLGRATRAERALDKKIARAKR